MELQTVINSRRDEVLNELGLRKYWAKGYAEFPPDLTQLIEPNSAKQIPLVSDC